MSASNPSGGHADAENELLARLGLPPSASPEDVDQLHLAVSQYLAAAPAGIRGWAHAQAASLDEAYLSLTDPVGLEGSALRSPTRPPTVAPGGPATPPARRDPVPAVEAAIVATELVDNDAADALDEVPADDAAGEDAAAADDTDTDDMDALFASVTPGAHRDLVSGGKPDKQAAPVVPKPAATAAVAATAAGTATRRHTRSTKARVATPVPAAPASSGPWKAVAIGATAVLALVVVIGFVVPFVFNFGSAATANAGSSQAAVASPTAPAVDQAKIATLMTALAANPKDTATLKALGDEYFGGQQFAEAATFYDKWLAIEPNSIDALLARGATYYNAGDDANAEKLWKQVAALKPTDKAQAQEVHYDLGFLYLNSATPNWTGVQSEWNQVIAIDSTTQLAQTVQQHLDSLVAASMIPAPSGSAGASAASGAGSAAPSGSPAANVVTETAKNQAFGVNTLNAKSGAAFTLHFDNQDSGLPHDIMIKDASGNTVFKGATVTGPNAVDYAVPALAAGTYTFTCSIHPTAMNGTLVVGN